MKQPQLNVRLINAVFWLLLVMMVMALLFVGRDLFIPFIMATFVWYLANVLAIIYGRLSVAGHVLPKWLAYLFSGTTILVLIQALVQLVTRNVYLVVEAAPDYQRNLLHQFGVLLEKMDIEDPQAVTQYFADLELSGVLTALAKGMASLIGNLGLIGIYLLFIFLEQRFFMKKIERILMDTSGQENVLRVLQAIDGDIRTYIGVKTFTSLLTGVISFAIMRAMGLDFADFWALLIFVLNFIPNIGSIVATILPSLLALVQFDSATPFLVIFFGVTATQVIIGNILDPNLMGHSLNISPLVIILSLVLWGFLWGVPGMFLGVPMMVMVMIVLYRFDDTRWVAMMLSKDGRLRD